MSLLVNWASTCANQTCGSKGQKGGSLTFTAVIWVAAIVGAVSSVIVSRWDHQCTCCWLTSQWGTTANAIVTSIQTRGYRKSGKNCLVSSTCSSINNRSSALAFEKFRVRSRVYGFERMGNTSAVVSSNRKGHVSHVYLESLPMSQTRHTMSCIPLVIIS